MTQTADAPRRALLVIDMQNEYFSGGGLPIEYPPTDLTLANVTLAMDTARAAGIPVIVVQHCMPAAAPVFARDSATWKLHPEIARRPREHLVEKQQPSVFAGTDLAEWLTQHGVDTLSVVGYMTHNCNAATIYEATRGGLKAELLADASGSLPYANAAGTATAEEVHRVFSVVMHTGFAAVASTRAWIAAVQAGTPLPHDNVYASNQRARSERLETA